jgi:hypothetical protein
MMLWALMAEREPWSEYTHAWEIANIVIEGKRETIPALWPSAIVNLIQRCVKKFTIFLTVYND